MVTVTISHSPEKIVAGLEALAATIGGHDEARHNELYGCNRITNDRCETRYCLRRGGWTEGRAVDYAIATCPGWEAHGLLQNAAFTIKSLTQRDPEMSVLEVKARAVVKAWDRLCACIDEMQPDQTHLCGEYEGALDDAIIALRKQIAAIDGAVQSSTPVADEYFRQAKQALGEK